MDASDRRQRAQATAHQARRWAHRRRFGWPGTEPPAGRNPIRHWGSLGLAIVAAMLGIGSLAQIAAGLAALSLILGAPRAWTWSNDRPSSLSWAIGLAMLVIGEILYLTGDNAVHQTQSGREAGAGSLVIAFGALVACAGYYRRWGTAGNAAYWDRQMRKGDPVAKAAAQQYAQRSGRVVHDDDD